MNDLAHRIRTLKKEIEAIKRQRCEIQRLQAEAKAERRKEKIWNAVQPMEVARKR